MIDFPNAPTLNARFSAPDGGQYQWDGVKWAPATIQQVSPNIIVSDTAPSNPTTGTAWWDSTDAQLYLWFIDPNSAAWVAASNQPGPPGPAGTSANMSGMVAGQIPISASATSVTSSANLSGDITSNATLVTTLATVNSNVGTFQGITVNAKGLVTGAVNQNYVTGGPYLAIAGGTLTGKLITLASATGGAGLNLPHGAAPTSPVNGDIWTTTAGIYVRINAATVGPLGASGASGLSGMTAGQIAIAATATTITSSIPTSTFLASAGGTMTGNITINLPATTEAFIRLHNTDTGTLATDGLEVGTSNAGAYVWNYENTRLLFATNNIARMTIAATGEVTTTGPIAAGNFTIPTTGHTGSVYATTLTTKNWLSHNIYIDTGAVIWRHLTGTGTGGVFGYDGNTQFAWYSTTNAAINAAVTLTNLMTLTNTGSLTTTGPIAAGNKVIPAGGSVQNIYTGACVSVGWLGFNAYVNTTHTLWLHASGSGTCGDFEYNTSTNTFVWATAPQVALGATVAMATSATLSSDGKLDLAGNLNVLNSVTATGRSFVSQDTTYSVMWTPGNKAAFYAGNSAVDPSNYIRNSNINLQGIDGTPLFAGFNATEALIYTALRASGVISTESGRIIVRGSANNPSVSCYDTAAGLAGGIMQAGAYFYLAQVYGDGSIANGYAYFSNTDRTMTLSSYGIRYPNAYGGSTNAIAFGWYSSYPPPAYGGISATIDSGGAQIGLSGTTLASDRRMKTNIAPSTFDSLAAINSIALRQFRWLHIPKPSALKEAELLNDTPLNPVGMIAQEVIEVFPEAVTPGDDFDDKLGRIWSLDNSVLIPALVGAVQQLTARLKALEEK